MQGFGLSIAVAILCYLNIYVKAIFIFSKTDQLQRVHLPVSMGELFKTSNIQNVKNVDNNVYDRETHKTNIVETNFDLRGLYSTLKENPTLMDRRLQIGGRFPPPNPDKDLGEIVTTLKNKRKAFDIGVAEPICPFTTEWVRLYFARDINNTEVEVFQPSDHNSDRFQWFYTVTCDYDLLLSENNKCPFCCRAVHHRRYSSQCVPRKTYVMALIRKPSVRDFDWGYIQVDSSCNCAVTKRPF